jgi:hypothetical protein
VTIRASPSGRLAVIPFVFPVGFASSSGASFEKGSSEDEREPSAGVFFACAAPFPFLRMHLVEKNRFYGFAGFLLPSASPSWPLTLIARKDDGSKRSAGGSDGF